jgi:uncharacterized membrane protein YhaH (DUF805 family)
MSIIQLLLVLGALWIWLGFNLSRIRDRLFPGMGDWVPLVLWFLLLIIPIAVVAWNTRVF